MGNAIAVISGDNDGRCQCGNLLVKDVKTGGPKKYCSKACRFKYMQHGAAGALRLGCTCDECLRFKRKDRAKREAKRRLEKRVFVSGQCVNESCSNWFITTSLTRSRMYCSVKCTDQDKHRRRYEPYRKGQRSSSDVVARQSGNKVCTRCDEWLPEYAFTPAPHTSDRLSSRCRRCQSDTKHGLTPDMRRSILAKQAGACAICRKQFDIHCGQRDRTYAIDHNHDCCPGTNSCGYCIRGLLCLHCNNAIGLFKDDTDLILQAAQYVGMQGNGHGTQLALIG